MGDGEHRDTMQIWGLEFDKETAITLWWVGE